MCPAAEPLSTRPRRARGKDHRSEVRVGVANQKKGIARIQTNRKRWVRSEGVRVLKSESRDKPSRWVQTRTFGLTDPVGFLGGLREPALRMLSGSQVEP